MFYLDLFAKLSTTSKPNHTITVIGSDYFTTTDYNEIKEKIISISAKSTKLVIYTESIPVTARWSYMRTYRPDWVRLPGSSNTDEMDKVLRNILDEITEEFSFLVYYSSRTGLDNEHQVIQFLKANEGNILYAGRSSLIVDYCVAIRRTDDYILNLNQRSNEYISVSQIRDKYLSNWSSPATFVILSHIVRDDFGIAVDDLKPDNLIVKKTDYDLFDGSEVLPPEEFIYNLTMAMVDISNVRDSILSGTGGVRIRATSDQVVYTIFADVIEKWNPGFLTETMTMEIKRGISTLYMKLNYVAMYLTSDHINYSWSMHHLVGSLYLNNVKTVYDMIVQGNNIDALIESIHHAREPFEPLLIPIDLYREAIMVGPSDINTIHLWRGLYFGKHDIRHYQTKYATTIDRETLMEIAIENIPSVNIEEVFEPEDIYSSLTVKEKPRTIETGEIYTTTLPETKFNPDQRARGMIRR